ncbi:hypothetical protein ACFV9C_11495 [Kribbella sp. NPDC059898]|uniref:hypothetical protein n=1 Tax=Kribbella sp. NPDC059898 TaxID=3346995 RepID=UPI00364B7A18
MTLTKTSDAELEARTRIAFERFCGLLARSDPQRTLVNSAWTCRDVAAHLLDVLGRYTRRDLTVPAGLAESPREVRDLNGHDLARHADASVPDLLPLLRSEFEAYIALDIPLDARFPFHAGQTIDGAGARGNLLGELLVHGWDVARAVKAPWPIEARDAVLHVNGGLQVAPGWLDTTAAAGLQLRVRLHIVGGRPQLMTIDDGACTVTDADTFDGPVDVVLWCRAVPIDLLFVKRIGLAGAVRRGLAIVGGRRPWIGAQIPRLFLPV